MTISQLVQAMEEPASQDLEAWSLMPILRRALGTPSDPSLQHAIDLLSNWAAAGAHRRDLNRDSADEDSDAIQSASSEPVAKASRRTGAGSCATRSARSSLLIPARTSRRSGLLCWISA